jgi:hypothetical protein
VILNRVNGGHECVWRPSVCYLAAIWTSRPPTSSECASCRRANPQALTSTLLLLLSMYVLTISFNDCSET